MPPQATTRAAVPVGNMSITTIITLLRKMQEDSRRQYEEIASELRQLNGRLNTQSEALSGLVSNVEELLAQGSIAETGDVRNKREAASSKGRISAVLRVYQFY